MTYQLITRDAPTIWKLLNGVVCLYKPAGVSEGSTHFTLLKKLCSELNELDCRPPRKYVQIEGDTTKEMDVLVHENFADDPLVTGPRYQERDFRHRCVLRLGFNTSGVFLIGLNGGVKTVTALDYAHHLRTFHVHGQLGRATDTFFTNGRVVERSKFKHVTRPKIDKYLATIQAAHQKSMFELSGLDIQSQSAYDLAVQGLIRPADPYVPMIYGIKCVEFDPPDFTIEVHCTNEHEIYLMQLINEIGMKLHTNAVCTRIRCIRHAFFNLNNALLRKHWTLEHVLNNIKENKVLLKANPDFFDSQLKKANLDESKSVPLLA